MAGLGQHRQQHQGRDRSDPLTLCSRRHPALRKPRPATHRPSARARCVGPCRSWRRRARRTRGRWAGSGDRGMRVQPVVHGHPTRSRRDGVQHRRLGGPHGGGPGYSHGPSSSMPSKGQPKRGAWLGNSDAGCDGFMVSPRVAASMVPTLPINRADLLKLEPSGAKAF
jgi:hypothetical protein